MKIYAIKDTIVGAFTAPFYQKNNSVAIRTITNAINNERELQNNAKDLQLYCLGEFNEETGEIQSNVEFIINIIDLTKQGE